MGTKIKQRAMFSLVFCFVVCSADVNGRRNTSSELERELLGLFKMNRRDVGHLLGDVFLNVLDFLSAPDKVNPKGMAMLKEVLKMAPPKVPLRALEKLMSMADDRTLPLNAIRYLQANEGNSSACVQRLLCRVSPIIWGIQQSFSTFPRNRLLQPLSAAGRENCLQPKQGWWPILFPAKDTFNEFGDNCDERFPFCIP